MHHFAYRDGVLHAEDVPLPRLAAEVGTPFYCYSTATLERHYRVLAEALGDRDALVCYALKANSNQAVLATLAAREAGIVRLRFGLTDGRPRTLDEIGQVYGVTRERIRQIESKTMSKLRHPSRSRKLKDYLD